MSEKAPLRQAITVPVEAVSTAANDLATVLGIVPFAGVIEAVTYTPANNITGAATNNRKVSVVNAGTDGDGTTEAAEEQFVSGVSAAQYDALALTLSTTAANRDVSAGDVLVWKSTHIGTGIADPGGTVTVTIARA